jgi:hypothetical protein
MAEAPIRCCGCGLPIVDCKPETHRVNDGTIGGPEWLCHSCRYAYESPRYDEPPAAFLERQEVAYAINSGAEWRRYLEGWGRLDVV